MGELPDRRRVLEEFASLLRALRLECGQPSYTQLHRECWRLSPASLREILNAKSAPKLQFVLSFVSACVALGDRSGATIGDASRDRERWERSWRALQSALRGLRATTRSQPVAARGGVRHAAVLPRQLPLAPGGFVGRSAEMSGLDEALGVTEGDLSVGPRVLVVSGMAGVGKTALTVAWAHRRSSWFPDGQLFADLRGFGPGSSARPAEILGGFLTALGVTPDGSEVSVDALSGLFRSCLADRQVLVVLDNAANAAQVRPLLPGTSTSAVIVTSRRDLDGLSVREGARHQRIEPLRADAARRVLSGRRGRNEHDVHLDRLAELCGRLPLALRLMAHRLESAGPAVLVASLESADPSRLFDVLERGLDDDSASLSVVLSWSQAGLSESEQRAFRLLAHHPGRQFGVEAGAAVLGVPAPVADRLIKALVAVRLLERPRERRYAMHDLVRASTVGLSGDRAELDAALDRACSFYLHAADQADRILLPQRQRPPLGARAAGVDLPEMRTYDQALRWVDIELPNLMAVIQVAAATGRHRTAVLLPSVLMSYFNLRKPWAEWEQAHEVGIASARASGDRLGLGHLLQGLGIAYRETGRGQDASGLFRQAEAEFDHAGDKPSQAMALNNLAITLDNAGRLEPAIEALHRASRLVADTDPWRASILLHNLAEAEQRLGRLEDALSHAEEAKAKADSVADRGGSATTLTTIAAIHARMGATESAEREYEEAIGQQQQAGDLHGQAITHRRLGELLTETNQPGRARQHLVAARGILESLGAPNTSEIERLLDAIDRPTTTARASAPDAQEPTNGS